MLTDFQPEHGREDVERLVRDLHLRLDLIAGLLVQMAGQLNIVIEGEGLILRGELKMSKEFDDLSAAVSKIGDAIQVAIGELNDAHNNGDNAAAEAAATKLSTLADSLTAAGTVAAPPPPPDTPPEPNAPPAA